jgi:hypothetical protein
MTDGCAGETAKADGAKVDVCQGGGDLVDNRGPVPRALRHAVYAETLLPDEDVTQFEALRAGLLAEFTPAGPLEDDVVAALARLIWRKQHLTKFRVPGTTSYNSLMSNLDLEDRLDRLIDRCVKRLLFVRGVKSVAAIPPSKSRPLPLAPPERKS